MRGDVGRDENISLSPGRTRRRKMEFDPVVRMTGGDSPNQSYASSSSTLTSVSPHSEIGDRAAYAETELRWFHSARLCAGLPFHVSLLPLTFANPFSDRG